MRLLERKPAKRLGMLAGKAADVKRHQWFDGFDWAGLEARRLIPPRKPKVRLIVNRQGCAAWLVLQLAAWFFSKGVQHHVAGRHHDTA